MAVQTATAPTKTEATDSPRTRKVEVEIHTAESLAELIGLAPYMIRGITPPHATRIGADYLVIAEHADRLRAIRGGMTVERAYDSEIAMDLTQTRAWNAEHREHIAAAEARERARQDAIRAENKRQSDAYRARETVQMESTSADVAAAKSGQARRNVFGDRVV
jgi:hypothetical protein